MGWLGLGLGLELGLALGLQLGIGIGSVMLSPRGQAVLEAKILSSDSSICPRPVLELLILAS